ncbi:16S rRNA (cytosine(1402)-N(4))-methyltransferase RsmH [Buchnera aphidicola]|uniref:16S rRNA (cytosine(1402)-N(4))-methyltransferase RsmH n=1 Tax=Buchnera aphidicola TaxID=9 RepID=UPI0020934C75|nr:16S rRNA (cytosine(1402)-N(4))-methyltransferase RsmH [Buchnera aphidicola]USS94277.1 16S rRNA (cytosine(1402)-N(4))-methyltransferase RsmH [Buchnera aphidicola (Sipha maydis)]WII23827.1 16S rRNA (cytosine(1402)-N(4))-methyltransferase RsmH [Buchnera aphidicola (Sipha maydis)]
MHIPVLLKKSIKALKIQKNGIYIDGTFGAGGHSKFILKKINDYGKLYSIDRDPESIKIAKKIKDKRFTIIHGLFSNIYKYCKKYKIIKKVNGIILDLGMSSMQLNNNKRGFSFKKNGPLDMRMNQKNGIPVSEWLLHVKEKEIAKILKKYGEEKYYKRIAFHIFRKIKRKPILKTCELSKIISKITPRKNKKSSVRTFQALRIKTNNELNELKDFLKNVMKILAPKGRLCIISFHSLEDRIIKKFMFQNSRKIPNLPKNIPLTTKELEKLHERKCKLKVFKKIFSTKEEILQNPRCRSAILRIAELK